MTDRKETGFGAVLELRHPPGRSGETIQLEMHDPDDHIARVIRRTGTFYEGELLGYLEALYRGELGGVALDIGANIGNHAVFFRRFLKARVLAVEPNPDVLPILRRNLERGASEGAWRVVGSAVGATPGMGRLVVPPEAEGNVGMARLREGREGSGREVEVTTVDVLVEEHVDRGPLWGPVRLIKVDVEGLESEVLEGAGATLDRFAPDLLLEAITPGAKARLDALLAPRGYASLSVHGATPVYHYAHRPSIRRRSAARVQCLAAAIRRLVHGR